MNNKKKRKRSIPIITATNNNILTKDSNKNNTKQKNILMNGKNKCQFNGKIIYVNNNDECNRMIMTLVLNKLSTNSKIYIGMDCEWRVLFKKGVKASKTAVLQLAISDDVCLIIHIHHIGISTALRYLLLCRHVRKVGLNILGDARKLAKDYNISVNGLVELNSLHSYGVRESLQSLVYKTTYLKLDKDESVRLSNWEHQPLNKHQLLYASTDAYSSLLVFKKLFENNDKIITTLSVINEDIIKYHSDKSIENQGLTPFQSKIYDLYCQQEYDIVSMISNCNTHLFTILEVINNAIKIGNSYRIDERLNLPNHLIEFFVENVDENINELNIATLRNLYDTIWKDLYLHTYTFSEFMIVYHHYKRTIMH